MDAATAQAILGGSASALVSQAFNTVEVRTAVTPTITFSLSPNAPPPDPVTRQILDTLRPTVVLSGPAGAVQLAPYGQTQGATSWWPLALVGVGVVGFLGWAVFGD